MGRNLSVLRARRVGQSVRFGSFYKNAIFIGQILFGRRMEGPALFVVYLARPAQICFDWTGGRAAGNNVERRANANGKKIDPPPIFSGRSSGVDVINNRLPESSNARRLIAGVFGFVFFMLSIPPINDAVFK